MRAAETAKILRPLQKSQSDVMKAGIHESIVDLHQRRIPAKGGSPAFGGNGNGRKNTFSEFSFYELRPYGTQRTSSHKDGTQGA